ncbi:hypothetical protein TKK_0005307 [Trichogramma kaykai]
MKCAVAFAVLFLVCGMRARSVEDDVKDMGMIKEMDAQFNKIYFDTNKHRSFLTLKIASRRLRNGVADATLSTSFSAAKCLTKTVHAAEMAWFKAPGKRELLKFKRRYPLSVKQLEDCKQSRAIEDLKVAAIQAEREVIDCMSESIVNKALKKII